MRRSRLWTLRTGSEAVAEPSLCKIWERGYLQGRDQGACDEVKFFLCSALMSKRIHTQPPSEKGLD